MGQQHTCCISQTELDYPNQRKGFYLVKGKRELFKNHSGHEDSVVTLPYQEEQRQQSVQVEDINSEQVLEGINPLSTSQCQSKQQKTKYQPYGQVRIREEYAKTFEPNDIDLCKSECPLERSSQEGKCRLVMTSNQGTYTVPSSPTKVHVVNQLRIDFPQRSEYAEKMSQYLVQNCQDGFKNHYYLGNKELRGKAAAVATNCMTSESMKILQGRIESDLKFLQFRLNQLLDNDDASHVYIFVDANDCKFIKCMITGAASTVFAYGVYIFDIYIPEDYPQHPPRVHLKSSNSKIGRRLAPLLLEDGRVCLDILGIYLGIEKHTKNHWDPATSNLCQIIEAIRSEILCKDVYRSAQLAEGEEEEEFKTDENVRSNLFSTTASSVNRNDLQYAEGYENVLKFLTMTQAIENMMETEYVDVELEKAITQHFTLCSEKIQEKLQLWIEYQQSLNEDNQPKYTGLVEQHNREIARMMQTKGFVGCAKQKLHEIHGKLKKIEQIQSSITGTR